MSNPKLWISKEALEANAEACRTLEQTFKKAAAAYKALDCVGLALAALVVSDDIDIYIKELTKYAKRAASDDDDE